jgi:hypothetical protein
MARVHHVKKAQKDYPSAGIKKGDEYWWWKPMSGGRGGAVRRFNHRPKPSETTQSEYYAAVYSLQERGFSWLDEDDVASGIEELIGEIEEIRAETQGKYDNLPDSLQNGASGDLLQGRISSLENAISELEQIETSFDEPTVYEKDDETDLEYEVRAEEEVNKAREEWVQERAQEAENAISNIGDD